MGVLTEIQGLLAIPLFGGLAGLIWAGAKAWTLLRAGIRTDQQAQIAQRERWHQDLLDRAERAEQELAEERRLHVIELDWWQRQVYWWRMRAADLEAAIRGFGGGDASIPVERPYPERVPHE